MDYQDARDLIIRAIASLYLNAQSAAARVNVAQSRVTDSDVLYKLAKDKHDAGTATGVDVLRSQVQLANDKQALLVAQKDDTRCSSTAFRTTTRSGSQISATTAN